MSVRDLGGWVEAAQSVSLRNRASRCTTTVCCATHSAPLQPSPVASRRMTYHGDEGKRGIHWMRKVAFVTCCVLAPAIVGNEIYSVGTGTCGHRGTLGEPPRLARRRHDLPRGISMRNNVRLRRSLLFLPASRPDRFEKALATGADVVCVDLEDGVAPGAKDEAREQAFDLLRTVRRGPTERILRINDPNTELGRRDLHAFCESGATPDALMLPKVMAPGQIGWVEEFCGLAIPISPSCPWWKRPAGWRRPRRSPRPRQGSRSCFSAG